MFSILKISFRKDFQYFFVFSIVHGCPSFIVHDVFGLPDDVMFNFK